MSEVSGRLAGWPPHREEEGIVDGCVFVLQQRRRGSVVRAMGAVRRVFAVARYEVVPTSTSPRCGVE